MPHATITDADFRRLMKAPSPGKYLFFGDEDYLKAHSAEAVRKVLCPDESLKLFNCVTARGIRQPRCAPHSCRRRCSPPARRSRLS